MNEKIKILQIIHLGLCAGLVVAYIAIGNLLNFENISIPKLDAISAPFLAIPLGSFLLSNFMFKQQLQKVDSAMKMEEKLPIYQTAFIMRMAILEGAAFVILILKKELIVFGLLLIAYMIFLRPTMERIENDFNSIKY